MPLLPNRRWLRFSIRALLIAVTVFCVWLGWQVSIVRAHRHSVRIKYASAIMPGAPEEAPLFVRWLGFRSIRLIELMQEGRTVDAMQQQATELKEKYPEAEIAYYDNAGYRHVFE